MHKPSCGVGAETWREVDYVGFVGGRGFDIVCGSWDFFSGLG